jgi:hypothetical protein
MTEESIKPERRCDVDLTPVQDARTEKLRKLREHLRRPIQAREASGEVRLNGDALRRHADLDRIAEHPMVAIRRRLREERESA